MAEGVAESKRFIPYQGNESIILRALRSLEIEGNLRLVGEQGSGKSTLVHTLKVCSDPTDSSFEEARANFPGIPWDDLNGKPWVKDGVSHLYEMSLTADTTRWDLIGTQTLSKGSTEISLGPLAEWLEDQTPEVRKVLFLDEWNYAAAGITSTMNQLADFRRSVYVSELGILDRSRGVTDKRKIGVRFRTDDHWLIVAENPYDPIAYSGTNPPNVAQLARYPPIYLPYMSEGQEVDLLAAKAAIKKTEAQRIVQWCTAIRQRFRSRELKMTLSPRNSLFLARLYANSTVGKASGWDAVMAAFVDYFPDEDKGTIRDIVSKVT